MTDPGFSCPLPIRDYPQVLMAHGGGGTLSQHLLDSIFLPAFRNAALAAGHDGAVLPVPGGRIAFTTDSFVVHPLEFPGGDIGKLAICGTVNDLAMCGALPRWLSVAFILEEGLSMELLKRVVHSMRDTARLAGVELVTGDTKVVDRGKGDGIFINTAGVGTLQHSLEIAPRSVRPGDRIIVTGDLGRHGMAILSVREGLAFETPILSDCGLLSQPVQALLEAGVAVHCLRDLTRGGLSSALNEIAASSGLEMEVEEAAVPVSAEVQGACELLGLDALYVANEGRFVLFLKAAEAEGALEILRQHPITAGACCVGEVREGRAGMVLLRSRIGTRRILDRLSGEQLPRIC